MNLKVQTLIWLLVESTSANCSSVWSDVVFEVPECTCASNEVEDCNGNCAPLSALGNGSCNSSSSADFDCSDFSYDNGDCLAENCTNGVDDDNDGDTDCDDSECSGSSSCLPDLEVTYFNCGTSSVTHGDSLSCSIRFQILATGVLLDSLDSPFK